MAAPKVLSVLRMLEALNNHLFLLLVLVQALAEVKGYNHHNLLLHHILSLGGR